MPSVKYENYKVNGHIFTVKFTRYRSIKKSIRFQVMPAHNHPQTLYQRIREHFRETVYKVGHWNYLSSRYPTIEDRLAVELKDLVEENQRIFDFDHWWWH